MSNLLKQFLISWKLFFSILTEVTLVSLSKAITEEFDIDSEDDRYGEECKSIMRQAPLPKEVYGKSFKLLTFDYLTADNVWQLETKIHDLYRLAEGYSKEYRKYKKVIVYVHTIIQTIKQLKVYKP